MFSHPNISLFHLLVNGFSVIIIITSETRGQSTCVVITITQYFGKFSKIFDALITHKVVVIVIVFFFHCLSIDVALFLMKLVSHVFACIT